MRWLVEVTSLGKADKESLSVEAESWQKALQAAREQRGESAPMSGFSIELLDDGCRAVDPASRLKYEVHRAPDEGSAARTPSGRPAGSSSAPPRARKFSQPPRPSSQPPPGSSQPPKGSSRPPPGSSQPSQPVKRPPLSAAALSAISQPPSAPGNATPPPAAQVATSPASAPVPVVTPAVAPTPVVAAA